MEQSVTLRPRFGRVLTVIVGALIVFALGSLVAAGSAHLLARSAAPLVFFGFLVWMTFWAPCIRIDPAHVSFVNVVRTRDFSWPAIQRIDTKYALTLYTAEGKFTAWSAPAPGRHSATLVSKGDLKGLPESTFGAEGRIALGDIPTSDAGLAALHVRRIWEQYRDAGLFVGIDGSGVVTTWHKTTIVILVVLFVATVLSLTL